MHMRQTPQTTVTYAILDSPVGRLLMARTAKGICSAMLGDDDVALEASLRTEHPQATLTRSEPVGDPNAPSVAAHFEGRSPVLDLPLDVQGTAFQWKVWRHLQSIPYGETRSYSEVAAAIGSPSAVRAVARACATNKVCLVIPCHRVVAQDGGLAGYRWGIARKKKLLQKEAE